MTAGAPQRLAFTVGEAARALSLGETAFRQHVLPNVRVARAGRKPLIPRAELERFLDRHAALPLADELRGWRR